MPSILVIVSPRDFREEELFIPLEVWKPHLDVSVASTRRGAAHGMAGGVVNVPRAIGDFTPHRFDGVAVIGGTGARRYLWDSSTAARAVTEVARRGGLSAAICYGVVVLARAGLLAGRRATGYAAPQVDIELRRGGARVTPHEVVVDDSVISASGPEAAAQFGRTVLAALAP